MVPNHFFIQGTRQIGKSTYLRTAINDCFSQNYGLTVQRVWADGQVVGYQVAVICGQPLPAADLAYQPHQPGLFLWEGRFDVKILEQAIRQLEEEAAGAPFLFLDEIGGLELASSNFMNTLERLLTAGIPCLGVLKWQTHLSSEVQQLQFSPEVLPAHERLVSLIKEKGSLLTVKQGAVSEIRPAFERFLRSNRLVAE